ncbi:MAG: putative N6-adenine-specific methylase [Thermotogaceae bacterium]|jgi:putative N6-adenine-specific DNA methylase|nr:putative N6-adenine-specific methylase [Thermotogaceae bacterium]MDN5337208.1 putative N6-adenine-specific methylase [Thermotogaceae bacterium]
MIKYLATCASGLEGALCKELRNMDYKILHTIRGRVLFEAPIEDVFKLNLWLRTAERVIMVLKQFKAENFDELFDGISQISWGDYINKKGAFPIAKVKSNKSKLFSLSDIQAVSKKAIVASLSRKYKIKTFEEKGPVFPVHLYIKKDIVTIGIDTTGENGLHKRGYRIYVSEAPLRETIAAAMVLLSNWNSENPLWDPFCGSGTIPIEASMIALNIAPGLFRKFICNYWPFLDSNLWKFEVEKAKSSIKSNDFSITGSDISAKMIEIAILNAKNLKLHKKIKFENKNFFEITKIPPKSWIITNPPYGRRLQTQESQILKQFKKIFEGSEDVSLHFLSSSEKIPKVFEKKPRKTITIYNSSLKTYLYQYW